MAEDTSKMLSEALMAFVNTDRNVQKQAEQWLTQHETMSGFMSLLITVIQQNPNQTCKLAGCIYLKNSVKRNWSKLECHFERSDCEYLVQHLVPTLVQMDKSCKKQLQTLMVYLNEFVRPESWGFFKDFSDLVKNGLNQGDADAIEVGLEVIDAICAQSWRNKLKDEAMFNQIKISMAEFLPTWKGLVCDLIWPRLQDETNPAIIQKFMLLMQYCTSIGHSWSYELPDEVEEQFSFAMEPFYKILSYQADKGNLLNERSSESLANCWTAIIHILRLMASNYEEANKLYSKAFLPVLWDLVPKLNDEKFYSTVVTALKYFNALVKTELFWTFRKTETLLNELVENILVRHLQVDDDICEQFESDPDQFITADLYASDMETKRRQAIVLIQTMCACPKGDLIKQYLGNYVQQLISQYEKDRSGCWKHQLLAIDFLIGLAVEGQTKTMGVTRITKGIPVEQFFTQHIFKELDRQVASPMVLARCIRVLNMFRMQLPPSNLMQITTKLAEKYLTNHGQVISSYVAMLIGNCAKQKTQDNQFFISDQHLKSSFENLVKNLIKSFANDAQWFSDTHRMEALMYLCHRCQSEIGKHGPTLVEPLQALINRSATQPHSPEYTYFLYETLGIFVSAVCNASTEHVTQLEKMFGSTLEGIVHNRKIEDVIPFAYQIMALLMMNYTKVPQKYVKLFDFICNQSGRDSSYAIPFLSVYMAKTNMFSEQQRLQSILQTIDKLLRNDTTIRWGLDIADAVLRNEAIAENHQVAKQVFKVILNTLMSKQIKPFVKKDFCRLMVNFIIKYQGTQLRAVTNGVQNGFYLKCVEVIVKFSEDLPTFVERRRFIMALISLISDQNTVKESPMMWKGLLEKCVTLLESRMKVNREEDRLDILKATGQTSSTKGSLLRLSMSFMNESIPSIMELKSIFAKAIKQLNQAMPQTINQNLLSQFDRKYGETVMEYLIGTRLQIS